MKILKQRLFPNECSSDYFTIISSPFLQYVANLRPHFRQKLFNQIRFRLVRHLKMNAWTSVLWEMNTQMAKNNQIWSYNRHLWGTFTLKQSLSFQHLCFKPDVRCWIFHPQSTQIQNILQHGVEVYLWMDFTPFLFKLMIQRCFLQQMENTILLLKVESYYSYIWAILSGAK